MSANDLVRRACEQREGLGFTKRYGVDTRWSRIQREKNIKEHQAPAARVKIRSHHFDEHGVA
jgi:hypothetical protein